MKVLITGGAGFIGLHLSKHLISHGHDVVILDSLLRENKLFNRTEGEAFRIVRGDVLDFGLLKRLIRGSDVVYHLAAISRVLPSIERPRKTFRVNVTATEFVARICAKERKKMIFSSSREIYGSPYFLPVSEDHLLNPESPYGASKAAAENILNSYKNTYGLEYVSLRLSNVYGLGDFDRVIPLFIDKLRAGEVVYVYGGHKMLDFIDVDTVCKIMEAAVQVQSGYYNVSSGEGVLLTDLAKNLKDIIKSESLILISENRANEIMQFIGNPQKIIDATGISIQQDIYEYIKKNILSGI